MLNLKIQETLEKASLLLEDPNQLISNSIELPPVESRGPDLMTKRILTYLETRYHFEGSYPNEQLLLDTFKITARELRASLPEINMILASKRFLPPFEVDSYESEFEFDPEFLIAVNLISDPSDRKSVNAKLKLLDKTSQWWKNQLKEPRNKELFALRVNESWSGVAEVAKISLLRNVEAGDLPTIKYVDEKTGVSPQQAASFDFIKVINQFMEILVHYLTPEQMEEVVNRFEATITVKELSA